MMQNGLRQHNTTGHAHTVTGTAVLIGKALWQSEINDSELSIIWRSVAWIAHLLVATAMRYTCSRAGAFQLAADMLLVRKLS